MMCGSGTAMDMKRGSNADAMRIDAYWCYVTIICQNSILDACGQRLQR